jgi:DnaK suppressor protein
MHKTGLSPHERGMYHTRLAELNNRPAEEVNHLASKARHTAVEECNTYEAQADAGDVPAQLAQEEVVRTTLTSEGLILLEVLAAIARLEGHSSGLCERCGKSIGKVRLQALPYARRCATCSRPDGNQNT